jgi:zinc transporter 9
MFIGSMLAGYLPLILGLHNNNSVGAQRWMVFGSGLLVGTVLMVILPEGLEAVYHKVTEASLSNHTVWIGPMLAAGFLSILLIDQTTSLPHHYLHVAPSAHHDSVSLETENAASSVISTKRSATLGLLVHAAADGIAMGAVSATHRSALELVIFFAILLHKAPAAFGLTTMLSRDGQTRKQIIKQLLLFSAAAPTIALLTFGVVSLGMSMFTDQYDQLPEEQFETLQHTTGLLILFSAGSFLYVTTIHALPDALITLRGHQSHTQLLETDDQHDAVFADNPANTNKPQMQHLMTLLSFVGGLIAPALFTLGHQH